MCYTKPPPIMQNRIHAENTSARKPHSHSLIPLTLAKMFPLPVTLTNNISRAQIHNRLPQFHPGSLRIKRLTQTSLPLNRAACSLLECNELGTRRKDESVARDGSVCPEFLDGSLHAIDGDGDVGVGAGMVVG